LAVTGDWWLVTGIEFELLLANSVFLPQRFPIIEMVADMGRSDAAPLRETNARWRCGGG